VARFDLVDYLLSKSLGRARLKDTELVAQCPFHSDSSPSFSVNIKTGAWLCRASNTCGKKGGLVALISKLEGISFKEAARKAQVSQPFYSEQDFEDLIRGGRPTTKKGPVFSELPACVPATSIYPEYLNKRRYPFESGVAAAWDLRVGTRGHDAYKGRFADYLILPVYDRERNYLSFTARYMGSDKTRSRYDGPSDSLKDYLYGEWQLSSGSGPVYLSEGQFDVHRLWTFGEDALGTFGTTYTDKQVLRLCNLVGDRPLVVCFDVDTINRSNPDFLETETLHSTPMRLVSQLLSIGKNCSILDVVPFKDPDEIPSLVEWQKLKASHENASPTRRRF